VDYLILIHEIQSHDDLVDEPLGQGEGEPLELVVLDELIQVYAQQLEGDAGVTPESEAVLYAHDVLGLFRVVIPEELQDLHLYLALLVQLLAVLQNFEGDNLLVLVVKAFKDNSEGPAPKALEDLVSILDLVVDVEKVVSLVIVKSMVEYFLFVPFASHLLRMNLPFDIGGVQIVDDLGLLQLFLLYHCQHLAENSYGILPRHWEGRLSRHRIAQFFFQFDFLLK